MQPLELEHPREAIGKSFASFLGSQTFVIKGIQDNARSMHDDDLHLDIDAFPPLDGTLDLELLAKKDYNYSSQNLIGACVLNLEYVDFTWVGGSFHRRRGTLDRLSDLNDR